MISVNTLLEKKKEDLTKFYESQIEKMSNLFNKIQEFILNNKNELLQDLIKAKESALKIYSK